MSKDVMHSESPLAKQVLFAIQQVAGSGSVSLHEPQFSGQELAYLKQCLDSSYVSSVGSFVDRFEKELAQYTGAKHAIAVVNGTAALHIALKLAGVQSDDEVLLPALTFIATANAVSYCGAVPHFVDSEETTLGIDAKKLRTYLSDCTEQRNHQCVNKSSGRVIRALVPVHLFGHPVDIDGLLGIARDFNFTLVEDAAESLGSSYHGTHTGLFGAMGALSFNGNKTITSGSGGAMLTNDSKLATLAKHLTTTAKVKRKWDTFHDQIGYNYRLANINAALGCAQLERLPQFLKAKRMLFKCYLQAFKQIEGVKLLSEPENCSSNYWLQTLILGPEKASQRDAILSATQSAGVITRPAWELINSSPPYQHMPCMELECAEALQQRIINLPSSAQLVKPDR